MKTNALRKFRLLPPVALLLSWLLGLGCAKETPPEAEVIRPVKAIVVRPAAEGMTRTFSGSARAGKEAALAFRVGGKVEEILVEVGDSVLEGKVLARLDASDFLLEVKNLEHNLESAEAAAKNSQNSYQRAKALYENSNIGKDELDSIEAQRNSDRAQVQALSAQLEQARNQLSYAELKSPFAGTVSNREVDEFETVSAGQPVLRVLDPGSIKVKFGIPESLVAKVRPGQEARIGFESFPGRAFSGRVAEVEPALDGQTGTYPVTVVLSGDHSGIRPGMAAEVSLVFEFSGSAGIVIPTSAILADLETGEDYVWIVSGGAVARRKVALGALGAEGVEIISGLEGGETVVVAGVTRLEEGRKVRLLDGEETR